MKMLEIFFELLFKYQRLKYELKCNYETHKMDLSIKYNDYLKENYEANTTRNS